MSPFTNLLLKIPEPVLRWRWMIMALFALSVTGSLFFQAQSDGGSVLDPRIVGALIVYALAFPLLGGIALSIANDEVKLVGRVSSISRQHAFVQQLANARDLEELNTLILQFPRTLLPIVGSALYLYNKHSAQYELVDLWESDGFELPSADPRSSSSCCSFGLLAQTGVDSICIPCCCLTDSPPASKLTGYCLPLVCHQRQIAVMYLFFPKDALPGKEQTDTLVEVAPEMALSLERMQLHRAESGQTKLVAAERNRISRYLHDTLGHDLAFIRLKLDMLSETGISNDDRNLAREMVRLREVANQSYEHLRGSLTELREDPSVDFVTAVYEIAETIHARSGFDIQVYMEGDPVEISGYYQRKILYTLREVLRNIEKHAEAKQVKLVFTWSTESLTVVVSDDGRGFDLESVRKNGGSHGLEIIRESVRELGGELILRSALKEGTYIKFSIPFD